MRLLLIPIICVCFLLAACSKEEPAAPAADTAVVDGSAEILDSADYSEEGEPLFWEDCAELPQSLSSCMRYVCALEMELPEDTLYTVLVVRGMKEGKCLFVQGIQMSDIKEELMHCHLNKTQQAQLSAYYRTLIEAEQQGLSEKDLPPDLLEDFTSKGICITPEYEEEEVLLSDGTAMLVEESEVQDQSYHGPGVQ